MRSFDGLLDLLKQVPDPRRAEGQLYKLPYVLLFSILAVVTGANSYRGIVTFIGIHRDRLNAAFGLHWKRAPAHTAVRYILQRLDPAAVEQVFRRHAAGLNPAGATGAQHSVALDGKVLRRSVDHFTDRKAAQVLHAFDTGTNLVLAHLEIDEKSNEIPAAQQLLGELDLARHIVTLDALHCQKNLRGRRRRAGPPHRPAKRQPAHLVAAGAGRHHGRQAAHHANHRHQGPQQAGNQDRRSVQASLGR